jgi:hypothetical protein
VTCLAARAEGVIFSGEQFKNLKTIQAIKAWRHKRFADQGETM